jgi:hypothetical protein
VRKHSRDINQTTPGIQLEPERTHQQKRPGPQTRLSRRCYRNPKSARRTCSTRLRSRTDGEERPRLGSSAATSSPLSGSATGSAYPVFAGGRGSRRHHHRRTEPRPRTSRALGRLGAQRARRKMAEAVDLAKLHGNDQAARRDSAGDRQATHPTAGSRTPQDPAPAAVALCWPRRTGGDGKRHRAAVGAPRSASSRSPLQRTFRPGAGAIVLIVPSLYSLPGAPTSPIAGRLIKPDHLSASAVKDPLLDSGE